jgi:hypothetical protein
MRLCDAALCPAVRRVESGSGLPVDGITRKQRDCGFRMRVSEYNSSLARSLLRGFCDARRQARSSALLTHPSGYGFHLRRTLRKCRASALGVAPTRLASPGVTRADREFKYGDSPCISIVQPSSATSAATPKFAPARMTRNSRPSRSPPRPRTRTKNPASTSRIPNGIAASSSASSVNSRPR